MAETKTAGQRIKDELRVLINQIDADKSIPSEHSLANRFGVSRTTVRLAINDLVNEGLLYRIKGSGTYKLVNEGLLFRAQGKGTYKCSPGVSLDDKEIYGFSAGLRQIYGNVAVEQMTLESANIEPYLAHKLKIPSWTSCWKFTRVWVVNGKPFAYGEALLRKDLLPNFTLTNMRTSLVETLEYEYGHRIHIIDNKIIAAVPNEHLQKKLQVSETDALLEVETCSENTWGDKL